MRHELFRSPPLAKVVVTRCLEALLRVAVLMAATLMAATAAFAQSGGDLREAAQNPIGDLISLPFQNNTNFGVGHSDHTQNVLNIQPVYPAHLNKDWNLIIRPILPVIYQPPSSPAESFKILRTWSVLTSATASSAWATLPQSSSSHRRSQSNWLQERVWSGVLGPRFSFQPPLTISLGPESGPPDRGLSYSCPRRR